jgi:hypothetical protein
VRLVRFLVGTGAAAAAAYIVVARRTESDAAAWSEYPVTQDWYPAGDLDTAASETAATTAPEALPASTPAAPIETGRFSLRGCASAPGHAVVGGVTFRRPLSQPVGSQQIELETDATDNVPDGGILILRDGGFAPSTEGFALMVAAAGAGPFSASGTYRVYSA